MTFEKSSSEEVVHPEAQSCMRFEKLFRGEARRGELTLEEREFVLGHMKIGACKLGIHTQFEIAHPNMAMYVIRRHKSNLAEKK